MRCGIVIKQTDYVLSVAVPTVNGFLEELEIAGHIYYLIFGKKPTATDVPYVCCKFYYHLTSEPIR